MSTTHEAPLVLDYRAMAADERRWARRSYRQAARYVRDAERQRRWIARNEGDETMADAVAAGRRLLASYEASAPKARERARGANARARRYDQMDADRRAEWARLDAEVEADAEQVPCVLCGGQHAGAGICPESRFLDALEAEAESGTNNVTIVVAHAATERPFQPRGRDLARAAGYVDPPFVCNAAGNDLAYPYDDSDAYAIVMGGQTGVFFPEVDEPDQGGRFVAAPPVYQAAWQSHVRWAVARLQPAADGPY